MLELPIHAAVTWWAVSAFGVVGAAAAWSLRAVYDAISFDLAVTRMVGRRTGKPDRPFRAAAIMTGAAAILSAVVAPAAIAPAALALAGAVVTVTFITLGWRLALEGGERRAIETSVSRLLVRGGPRGGDESVARTVRNQTERP